MTEMCPIQRKDSTIRARRMTVTVAIATAGRPLIVRDTLMHLARMEERPARVVLSLSDPSDFANVTLGDLPFPVEIIFAQGGLCAQRNAVLDIARKGEAILFLDDDFLIAEGYLSALVRLFVRHPDVVMATGKVLADGILGPGLDHAAGLKLLDGVRCPATPGELTDVRNGYGCNMALRVDPVLRAGLRFDTTLPRYGWLEDVDFSGGLSAHGRIVRSTALLGVHLGTKTGRSRGVPLGYSQIANPLYLARKGTMDRRRAYYMMSRNIVANVVKSARPETWVDRRGRLRGNLVALADLAGGRLSPGRILDL